MLGANVRFDALEQITAHRQRIFTKLHQLAQKLPREPRLLHVGTAACSSKRNRHQRVKQLRHQQAMSRWTRKWPGSHVEHFRSSRRLGRQLATGLEPPAEAPIPVTLITTPLFHVTANNCGAYGTSALGGALVLMSVLSWALIVSGLVGCSFSRMPNSPQARVPAIAR